MQEDLKRKIYKKFTYFLQEQFLFSFIIISKSSTIHSADEKSAFLQEKIINRDIYLKLPNKAETLNVWKLKKHSWTL